MLKRLMLTTATVALLTGSAFAQNPPRAPDPPAAAAPAAKGQVISQQTADQWLASKFKGTDVIGAVDFNVCPCDATKRLTGSRTKLPARISLAVPE